MRDSLEVSLGQGEDVRRELLVARDDKVPPSQHASCIVGGVNAGVVKVL